MAGKESFVQKFMRGTGKLRAGSAGIAAYSDHQEVAIPDCAAALAAGH
jgi:hypothetical protein